jgi:hypothetical protein
MVLMFNSCNVIVVEDENEDLSCNDLRGDDPLWKDDISHVYTDNNIEHKNGICSFRGKCNEGKCICQDGFEGDKCEKQTRDTNECPGEEPCSGKGKCIGEIKRCTCDGSSGYTGNDCSVEIY